MKSYLNELSKEEIDIQYNYDCHLDHQLVDESQTLGEFERFYCNRNVHNVSWYEKPTFLPVPHLIWYIHSQIPGKQFLRKVTGEIGNSCFTTPSLRKPRNLCQAKLMLWTFCNSSWLDISTFWLLVTVFSMPRDLPHNYKVMCK